MSSSRSIFAPFRNTPDIDLAQISEQHLKADLPPEDRSRLRRAASSVSTHATIGSLLGMGLGLALAYKIHTNRIAFYNTFKVMSKPTEVIYSSGRREAIPDLEPYIRPTRWSDAATYGAFGLGGFFLGGELGLLSGSASAARTISSDPDAKRRIEDAFRKFQIDVLKREVNILEGTDKNSFGWDRIKGQAAGMVGNLRA
ncbi:hypothetical protein OQA88_5559 [Cercophora sp. LCS_1]